MVLDQLEGVANSDANCQGQTQMAFVGRQTVAERNLKLHNDDKWIKPHLRRSS